MKNRLLLSRPALLNADALLSLLFALVAVLFGVRIYSWLTLLFTMASFANQRFSQMESQNALASIMLVCLTFVATHFKAMGQPLITPFAPWLRNKQAEL